MDDAYLRDLFAPLGTIALRAMFGGKGLYAEGLMFAIMDDGVLYLRADDVTRPDLEAAGSVPFRYMTKNGERTVKTFWRLPEAALDDPAVAARWARLAISAARRAAATSGPARRR